MVDRLGTLAILLAAAAPPDARKLQQSCDAGRVKDCVDLAVIYQDGRGVAKDPTRAATLYKRACDGGNASACFSLGLLYGLGTGVPKDVPRSAALYGQGCDGGVATACSVLAHLYSEGDGVPKDKARSAGLATKACDLDGRECIGLALKYKLGEGVPKDVVRAAALYKRACEAGISLGCQDLGQIQAAGDGVPRDLGRAAALFKQGCDGRDASACDHLGRLYATGEGVPKDLGRAAALFKQACQGVGAAFLGCYDLGRLYATGEGVPRDPGRAAALFRQACDGGYPFACNALQSIPAQGNGEILLPAASDATSKFDGRGWTAGNHQEDGTGVLTEYVLPGQTVENWRELVACRLLKDPRHVLPLGVYLDKIHESGTRCQSFVWNVIRQDERTAVYEHHHAGCEGSQPRSDLVRLAVGDGGIYSFAYAVRIKGPLPPEKRKEWMAILSQVPLAHGACAQQPAERASPGEARPAGDKRTIEALAERVRQAYTCPAVVKSARERSEGGITTWTLECSDGHAYTILVGRTGETTVIQKPK